MELTEAQRTEIREAVSDMAITDWGLSDDTLRSYGERVTWWIENRERLWLAES